MAVLRIRLYPDPVLRVECPEVTEFGPPLRRLAEDMVETMYAAPGVGLAAPQVGEQVRLTVVDVTVGEEEGGLHVLVNPVVVEHEGSEADFEGCLSIPGLSEKVDRAQRIVVQARDLEGSRFEFTAEGLLARAIQHEIDHLDGVLFFERLRGLRRDKARRQLKRLIQEQELTV